MSPSNEESSYNELREKKEELARSERLAFTGRIAASIAHEIRNPLGNVSMAVQQLQDAFTSDSPWAKHIEVITRNTERINFLITELLNCARPPKLNLQPHDIHEILESVVESVNTMINSHNIEVVKEFKSYFSQIDIDKEQMHRAFSNIIINAVEAMPEGGTIIIHTELERNSFVAKIKDTGKGISEEDIIMIFDPFYSTKPSGVGLGLSTCYGIIVSHGGTIGVESELNKGTVFKVSLPIS